MKILYIYQYFSTPKGSWGTRVYEFAREWVQAGHEVTVITAVYSKSDLKPSKFLDNQIIDGIKVKIINILIDNRQPIIKRIWSFLVFMIIASWWAIFIKADRLVVSSGPISVGVPALVGKYIGRKTLIFEVRDLWPQGAIEMRLITYKILIKFFYWFEKRCYVASNLVVTLSPGMEEDIKKRFNNLNVISITNSANLTLFGRTNNGWVKPDYINGKQYAIYTGNIGPVNNTDLLLKTAQILKDNESNLVILLVGDGQQKEQVIKMKDELPNLHFEGLMPKKELVPYIQNAMVSIIPLANKPVFDSSSPNKLFESLAAGVPVIQTTQGWIKDFLQKEQVGFTVSPDDPENLANLLIHLSSIQNEVDMNEMRKRTKEVARKYFDKTKLASDMLHSIINVSR